MKSERLSLKKNKELELSQTTFSSHGQYFFIGGYSGMVVLSSEQQA